MNKLIPYVIIAVLAGIALFASKVFVQGTLHLFLNFFIWSVAIGGFLLVGQAQKKSQN